jgi:hypothetical protein
MTGYPGGSQPVCPLWCTRTAGHHGPCAGAGREAEGISVQAALLPDVRTVPVVALSACAALTWPAVFLPPDQAAGVAVVLAALGHSDLAATITEVITEVTP